MEHHSCDRCGVDGSDVIVKNTTIRYSALIPSGSPLANGATVKPSDVSVDVEIVVHQDLCPTDLVAALVAVAGQCAVASETVSAVVDASMSAAASVGAPVSAPAVLG